jgi:hypothetical protein
MIDNLRHVLGERSACGTVANKSFTTYSSSLPAALVTEWREQGICAFGGGLLWFVDPGDFEDISGMWTHEEPAPPCIARTAFGDLIVWDELRGALYLDVIYDNVYELGSNFENVTAKVICSDDFRIDLLRQPIFNQVMNELGPLTKDEVYSFEPIPSIGGSGAPETLQKSRLKEYLVLLNSLR